MAVCWICVYRYLLILTTGVLLLQGCVETIPLQYEDISDHLWLRSSSDGKEFEGFFAGADGQLLLVDKFSTDGTYWELHDNVLLLWMRTEGQSMLQSVEYYPLFVEKKLLLSQSREEGAPVYVAETYQEPLSNVRYSPTYINGKSTGSLSYEVSNAYLQFDTSNKTLRGYGGVNNFQGSYERKGVAGFKMGPMVATMMDGPGMDYEIKLMQCLDQSDTILAVRKRILFYQNSKRLCSFSTN